MTSQPVQAVLHALEARGTHPKRCGTGWQARCPAHDDRNPSLAISEGDDGRALLKCHAGCELAGIVGALNLEMTDLFPDKLTTTDEGFELAWDAIIGPGDEARPAVATRYVYTDEDGRALFRVCRKEPKGFYQQRREGDTWVRGLTDTRRVLYRLPAVLEAAAAGTTVYVVEGEKDADALSAAGVVATCNPGGAGKWREEYTTALAGAEVVIVADKDGPGYAHAEAVRAAIDRTAASVRVVQAAHGKDAADHLASGLTVADFEDAPTTTEAPDRAGGLPPLQTFADVMDDLPPLAIALISGVLRQGHKLTLAGASKVGKSFLAIALALAIVEGREWLGWPCARGPVVYVNFEVDAPSFWDRVANVYRTLGWSTDNAADLHVWNLRGHARDLGELLEDLVSVVESVRPLALVIDPAYKVNTGDENSAQDWARFTRYLDELVRRSGAAVVLIHHHSKGQQGAKRSADRASGSGVVARDPDALIDVIELQESTAARECFGERLYRERLVGVLRDADDRLTREDMRAQAVAALGHGTPEANALIADLDRLDERIAWAKAVEVSTTLREFADAGARHFWYFHPVYLRGGEELTGVKAEGAKTPPKTPEEYVAETLQAFDAVAVDGEASVKAIAEKLDLTVEQTRTRIDKTELQRDRRKGTVTR